MSLNDGDSSWENGKNEQPNNGTQQTNQNTQQRSNNPVDNMNIEQTGLAQLFSMSSMTAGTRNLKEVADVQEQLKNLYERIKTSTTSDIQRQIIPEVANLTSQLSGVLPGLVFTKEIGGIIWVMPVLFCNRQLAISSERVRVAANPQLPQGEMVSIPLTPGQYANANQAKAIQEYYDREAQTKRAKGAQIIAFRVVDLDMLDHPEIGDISSRPHFLAQSLADEWEKSIMVRTAMAMAATRAPIPSPFQTPKKPYGNDNTAEARVNAISKRVNAGGELTAANMEVVASTINANNNNAAYQGNSREIARCTATVSLKGVSFMEHQSALVAQSAMQREQISAFLGQQFAGGNVYPNGYRPLRPVITIGEASAGEVMGYNGGLQPFFYGLYLLMATNNNYVFAEALRRHAVGSRGNLSNLEVRLEQLLREVGIPESKRVVLNEKNITDTELVNIWIRQNVSAHATFQVNLSSGGPNSALNNFLFRLSGPNNAEEVRTVVAVLDSMTAGKFSEILAENAGNKGGWTTSDKILHNTTMLEINGLATFEGQKLNTEELDEMMICRIKGRQQLRAIEDYLRLLYGATNEDSKARFHRLRMQLMSSIFDGAVHINTPCNVGIFDPLFMSALGKAMDSIGTMSVANNMGSWMNNPMVYAPGIGLATMASTGANNPVGGVGGGGYFNTFG